MSKQYLWRSSGPRTLPVPDDALYVDGPEGHGTSAWAALRRAGDPAGMSTWQRVAGWSRDGAQRVRYLLYLHRSAFEAERGGRYRAANFFWHEALARLRRLWARQGDWDLAAQALGVGLDGQRLRAVLATELFIDTHAAFANGRLQSEPIAADDRAFFHADCLARLLSLPHQAPLADFDTILLPAILAELDALEAARRYDDAIARIRREPRASATSVLGDRIAILHFKRTLDRLAPDPQGAELNDAATLKRGIDDLEIAQRDHPDGVLAYDLLAQLHHLRSIRLANGNRPSEALVECEKAMAYAPGFEPAEQLMPQLVEIMKALQARMKSITEEIRKTPDQTLNAVGMQMNEEAQRGFNPLDDFRRSGQAQRIGTSRTLAGAAAVWRGIAGSGTSTRPSDAQLLALRDVVSALYGSDLDTEEALAGGFARAAVERQDLPAVEPREVGRFIVDRRRHNAQAAESDADTAPPDAAPQTIPPGIAPAPAAAREHEPAAHWWFGSQDVGTRALAASAAACAIAVGGVATIEVPHHRARNEAVQQIRSAAGTNPETVLAAAESFLQARTLYWIDPRRDEVMDAYARAFVQWFEGIERPDADAARQRIARYRQMVAERGTP